MSHVTLTTDVKSFSKSSFSLSDTPGTESRIIQATRPTDSASVVIGTSLNYMKLKLYQSTATTETVYVWGWSFWPTVMAWVPQLLCSFTMTPNASSSVIPSVGTVYEMASATKITGDVKIYNGIASTGVGAFVMVDTVGCQFLEVTTGSDAATPTMHVFSAGL